MEKGSNKKITPDSVRIKQIIKEYDFKHHRFFTSSDLRRPPSYKYDQELDEIELKFLQWLIWMDKNWRNPTYYGIQNYLSKSSSVFGKKLESQELDNLIKKFVSHGILLVCINRKKHEPRFQVIRINHNHPQVKKIFENENKNNPH